MTTSKLDQAREWARDNLEGGYFYGGDRAFAAAEVIQSLPDQWIDAEKLREAVSKYEGNTFIGEIVQEFADLLPTPPLPSPEDVPEGETWIVEWRGHKWVGTREAEGNGPCMWALARLDSKIVDMVFDEHVTLISRLVPERKENA